METGSKIQSKVNCKNGNGLPRFYDCWLTEKVPIKFIWHTLNRHDQAGIKCDKGLKDILYRFSDNEVEGVAVVTVI